MNHARNAEPSAGNGGVFSRRFWRSALRGVVSYYQSSARWISVRRWTLHYRMKIWAIIRSGGVLGKWMESSLVVWVDGEDFFKRVEKLIRKARHTIAIQMFIWKDDVLGRRIAELLTQAADRGVRIDISKEAVGDGFEFDRDFLSTKQETTGVWPRFWSHPNISVHHGAEGDHTKAFMFDGRTLLVGGMNIADEYLHWHDYFVELKSSSFVEGFLSGEGAVTPQHSIALVLNSPRRKDIRKCLMEFLESAERRILLEQSYFSDEQVIELLARKSREGVRLTLILPAQADVYAHANMAAVARLLERGDPRRIRVFLYPKMLHAKVVLVDRKRAFLGSANLTSPSLDWFGEANVLIERWHFSAMHKLRQALRKDIVVSKVLKDRPRIGLIRKFLAWWGL